MTTRLPALALLLGCATPALAQQPTPILRGNGEKAIAVWRNEASAEAGARLANAGQADLAARYIACAVPPGTRIVVLPGGHAMHRVMIIDGKSRGCEGSVFSHDIKGDKAEQTRKWKEEMARLEAESKALTECGKQRTDAIRAGKGIGSFREHDDCMTARGFPPMKFDADGKPIKVGEAAQPASARQKQPEGWPEWKRYLECSEKRTDPVEDCTKHLQ